jgi:hypothetical protein
MLRHFRGALPASNKRIDRLLHVRQAHADAAAELVGEASRSALPRRAAGVPDPIG